MVKQELLPTDVLQALADAQRKPGWNSRSGDVKRFRLGACDLIVVPARRWAYRREEKQAAQWQREQVRA